MSARLNAVCSWDTSGCRGTRPAGCVFWWTERSFCVLFSRIFNLHFHSSQLSKVCEQKKPNTKEALSVGASPTRPLLRWSGSCRLSLTRESTCLALGSSRNTGR